MEKLTGPGYSYAFTESDKNEATNLENISADCLTAIAGNAGLAGLLSGAVVSLAFDTAILYCNEIASAMGNNYLPARDWEKYKKYLEYKSGSNTESE